MTEKRFSVGLRKNTTQYEIIDNYKTGEYPFIEPFFYKKTAKDLAKFLNALNDENEELKKERQELFEQREKEFIRNRDTRNEWISLKKENEQLKQTIQLIIDTAERNDVITKSELQEIKKEIFE